MNSLYSDQRTWLHAVPAGTKLALLAVLGTGLFLTQSPLLLLLATLGSCMLFISLGAARDPARRMVRVVFVSALLVAVFHVLLTAGFIPERMTPCVQGVPCDNVQIEWFGFVTIPLLSAASFVVIDLLLLTTYFKTRK